MSKKQSTHDEQLWDKLLQLEASRRYLDHLIKQAQHEQRKEQ